MSLSNDQVQNIVFWALYNVALFVMYRYFYGTDRYVQSTLNAFAFGGGFVIGLTGLLGITTIETAIDAVVVFFIFFLLGMLAVPNAWVEKWRKNHDVH